jgi:capsular polysaccharide biosynthesis protein
VDLSPYISPLRRRWPIVAVILVLDVVVSLVLFTRTVRSAGYQSCLTVYVADISSPSLITAPETSLVAGGQLLAGETAANFFGDDILDVAQSEHVALFVSRTLRGAHLPNTSLADLNGAVSGSRRDRTVQLCVTNPQRASAQAAATALGTVMTRDRAAFIGLAMAKRTYVNVISDPSTSKVSTRHELVSLAERIILGLVLALAIAYLWDALAAPPNNGQDLGRRRAVS